MGDVATDTETGLSIRFIRKWPAASDRVRDGRHLMNGTRWVDVTLGEAPPENCVGRRRVPGPNSAVFALAWDIENRPDLCFTVGAPVKRPL